MDIATILTNIMDLARKSNMTFEEMMEWLSRSNRDENIIPWEE